MAKFTWNRWTLQGSGWATSYSASADITAAFNQSTGKLDVKIVAKMVTYGGDTVNWNFQVKIGSETLTFTHKGPHTNHGSEYTIVNTTKNLTVSQSASSVVVEPVIKIVGLESLSGGTVRPTPTTATLTFVQQKLGVIESIPATISLGKEFEVTWPATFEQGYEYAIRFVLGDWYRATSRVTTSSMKVTLPIAVPASGIDILSQMPNSLSSDISAILYTYKRDSAGALVKLGTTTKVVKLSVPKTEASVQPTVTARAVYSGSNFTNAAITNVSSVRFDISSEGARGSSIVKCTIGTTSDDTTEVTLNEGSGSFSTPVIQWSGSKIYTIRVKDSRGIVVGTEVNVYSYSYQAPNISALNVVVNEDEGIATCALVCSFSPMDGRNTPRRIVITARPITSTSSTVTVLDLTLEEGVYSYSTPVAINLPDLSSETYEFTAYLYDVQYSSKPITKSVRTGAILISGLAKGQGIRFFGEADASDVGKVHMVRSSGIAYMQAERIDTKNSAYIGVPASGVNRGIGTTRNGVNEGWLIYRDANNLVKAPGLLKPVVMSSASTNQYGLIPTSLYLGKGEYLYGAATNEAKNYLMKPVLACNQSNNDVVGRWWIEVTDFSGNRLVNASIGDVTVFYI